MDNISIRPWLPTDSATELTELLHRLADMGLRFWATHQSVEVTEKRIAQGECFVAEADGVICGTIVFRDGARTGGCPWYDRPDVGSFVQFGVEPGLQAKGLGRASSPMWNNAPSRRVSANWPSIRRSRRCIWSSGTPASATGSSSKHSGSTPTIAASS